MHFEFTFLHLPNHPRIYRVKNTIVDEGADSLLKMALQGDNVILPAGNDWYIGLCNQAPTRADTLASITSEPTVTNGYARQTAPRSAVGFPTLFSANGKWGIRSTLETFTASGGDFSAAFTRAFLATSVDGTGKLIAYSGALLQETLLTDGNSFPMYFDLYI